MGRKKGSRNKSTLARLQAVYGDNKPTEEKPKRVRRTRQQLIADGYYDKDKPKETPKHHHVEMVKSYTQEEASELMIQRAKERGDVDWEFDFRKEYAKGQTIWFVEVSNKCRSKELLELHVGTVYSKFIIGYIDKGEAHHISVDDADRIFFNERDAKLCYSKVRFEKV